MIKGIELPNQDKIRTFSENKPYKYLGILEVDTMKRAEMKEKIKKKKNISGERENFSKQNFIAEISSKR